MTVHSDEELFEIIISGECSDHPKRGASLSSLVLRHGIDRSTERVKDLDELNQSEQIRGAAVLELLRRYAQRKAPRIRCPQDVYSLCRHLSLTRQEHFVSLSLNGAHDVIALRTVTIGLVNRAEIHPREIFADIITDRATALIIAHNHPSNCLDPSEADLKATTRLISAGMILGIPILDHIIFGAHNFCSLKEARPDIFRVNPTTNRGLLSVHHPAE